MILPGSSLAAGDQRKSVPASAARLALVVGNAKYVKLGKLDNPGRDARLMAENIRPTGVILVAEEGRALSAADVEDVLGVPVQVAVTVTAQVARAVDSGLLASRLPRSLERELRRAA